MEFPTPLVSGRLIRRYKRFFADVALEDGREVTAHCPNPGSMMGLLEPGAKVWLEPNDDPKRKLKFGWRLLELEGATVGIDTGAANRIVREALDARAVPGLDDWETLRAEVRYGDKSRVDFLLSGAGPDIWVEVKSVTLSRHAGLAEFPDSVTSRGARHLADLAEQVRNCDRAVLLYLVQRDDCDRVAVAADIDPTYAKALAEAQASGVEILCIGTRLSPRSITTCGPIPFVQG